MESLAAPAFLPLEVNPHPTCGGDPSRVGCLRSHVNRWATSAPWPQFRIRAVPVCLCCSFCVGAAGKGPHVHDLGLRDIVDLLLRVKAQAYSVEAATPRHAYEWRVWEDVRLPEGKVLIPGVIAHTTAVVEHPETVAERLMTFARVVGRERVMAGADCGFAQGALYQRQQPSVMWAKFAALVEGARLASERLWGA